MKILRFSAFPNRMHCYNYCVAAVLLLVVHLSPLFAGPARAEWKMAVQSRTVTVGETGVTTQSIPSATSRS